MSNSPPPPPPPHPAGGFSLFPHPSSSQPKPLPSNNPYRKGTPRPRAPTPSSANGDCQPPSESSSPPRNGRSTPQSHSQVHPQPPTSPPSPARHHRRHPSTDMLKRAASKRSTGNRSPQEGPRHDLSHREFVASGRPETPEPPAAVATSPHPVQQPHVLDEVPVRTETAFSEAPTLVRTYSNRSRSSIAKRPLPTDDEDQEPVPQVALRSIFPQYNPELPMDRQDYFPTQRSPTHIPYEIISRQPYNPHAAVDGGRSPPPLRSPGHDERHQQHHHRHTQTQPQSVPSLSIATGVGPAPAVAGPSRPSTSHNIHSESAPAPHSHPHQQHPHPHRRLFEHEPDPDISGTDELRALWKVANGWKASASEGRPFALRVCAERDAPVFTLTSANGQPFYNLRMDPRATTAYVILSRRDPSKPYKPPKKPKSSILSSPDSSSPSGILSSSPMTPTSPQSAPPVDTSGKGWLEVLTTTLEEPDRRLPPGDGLISLLYPLQAAKMALDRPDDEVTVMTAERECARLVWDQDSQSTYLVHPAVATPFRATIERHAAQCRTEYVLEHVESPRHLARLVRDGTGGGFLEVDTSVAARVDAVYVIDIAVTALLLVASEDEKGRKLEMFEPPPPPAALLRDGRRSNSRLSTSSRRSRREEKRAASGIGQRKFESFEVDIESQASSLAKMAMDDKDKKLPGGIRLVIKLITWFFKALFWIVMLAFKTLAAIVNGLAKCCGERDK
ncbi:uncharacterized protein MKZ38_007865 [Zalerion maritima]|uniref:Acetylserotonin methytransferase-like protein n=1 Tax=Zalerion maritima TaxID=339359 RepID=A0AAD5WVT6_9PEZI|nr:uncharacterized protein MKZ38_007865 [Zalerion maritima]